MNFLSDSTLWGRLNNSEIPEEERIVIIPPPKAIQLRQCSIDLTLSNQFVRFQKFPFFFRLRLFDPRRKDVDKVQNRWYKYYTATQEKGFIIRPNEVVLAMTNEWIKLPKSLFGLITGRSSFSRMGIEVQLTQDLRQPGHSGQVLLQLKNNAPFSFRFYPGMRIAQLLIGELDRPCEIGYDESLNSKYGGEAYHIHAKWFLDPELEDRQIISKSTYFKPFLDALLIAFGFTSIVLGIEAMISRLVNPLLLTSLFLTAGILIIRLYLYFRTA